ncbi:MAG: nuclear transport factor 2 family protein [Hyphomonadaceae bacterium]|nr:nuclear transport factor 2 family protein [Hyphomonadaceae bacterium]
MLVRFCLAAAAAFVLSAPPASAEWRAANEAVAAALREPRIAAVMAEGTRVDAAVVSGDAKVFEEALASDLAVNNPQNTVSTREMTARLNAQGFIAYSSYHRTIEYAGLRGDLVVIMGEERVVPRGSNPNAGREVVRRFIDLWKEEGGRWRLTARQASIVSAR